MASQQANDTTPVLIGIGQSIDRTRAVADAASPLDLLLHAARGAIADAGLADEALSQIDTVGAVRLISASPEARDLPFAQYPNPGLSVAHHLGLRPAQSFYIATGGNSPQALVNHTAEQIALGQVDMALLVGGDAWGSITRALAQGPPFPDWHHDPQGPKTELGEEKPGSSETELAHGFLFPVNTYPLFETAWRAHKGFSVAAHRRQLGALMAPLSAVAASNPEMAWFPVARTAEEICTVTDDNRMVGFPYPKYMNAVMTVNQAGAVLLTSVGKARALGVAPGRWVYLHGCAECNEIWFPTERPDLHRAHAIKIIGDAALSMAMADLSDMDFFDIYSCFPVALEIACAELGLAENDARGLTVTGGLPYYGGAGNAYTMLSLTELVKRLRARPNSMGLMTGNGWYLTKHAIGIYSTKPKLGAWECPKTSRLQKKIEAQTRLPVAHAPAGQARIEAYTVAHTPKGQKGLVIGRLLDQDKARFVAHTPQDETLFKRMMRDEFIGVTGTVAPSRESAQKGVNIFTPAA